MASKRPEDEACVDCLAADEAEWQDLEAKRLKAAQPEIRRAAKRAVALVRKGTPSAARKKAAAMIVVNAIRRALAPVPKIVRETVARQKKHRQEVFAKRSGKKLVVPKLTPKEIEQRIAKKREVEDVKPKPPEETG